MMFLTREMIESRLGRVRHYLPTWVQKLEGETTYSAGMDSVFGVVQHFCCLAPRDSEQTGWQQTTMEVLTESLQKRCGFTQSQMVTSMTGVTDEQLEEMIRLIATCELPLVYSWSEEELAQEVSLAVGRTIMDMTGSVIATFECQGRQPRHAYYTQKEIASRGTLRLLWLGESRYFKVEQTFDEQRGPGAVTYRLRRVVSFYSPESARVEFEGEVALAYGEDAVRDIVYAGR